MILFGLHFLPHCRRHCNLVYITGALRTIVTRGRNSLTENCRSGKNPHWQQFYRSPRNLARWRTWPSLTLLTSKIPAFWKSRWRPPFWKIEKSPCLSNRLTDRREIWQGDAFGPSKGFHCWFYLSLNKMIFAILDIWRCCPLCWIVNC